MQENSAKRIDWLDYAKGIVICLVIIGHNGHNLIYGDFVNRVIGTFDMPAFFIISGYLYKNRTFKTCISRNFKRLLIPYLFVSLFYCLWIAFTNIIHNNNLTYTIIDYLLSILCCYGFNYKANRLSLGALWFLTALFVSNVLFNFIVNTICKNHKDNIYIYIYSIVISIIGVLIGNKICLPFNIDIAMYAQVYLCFGYWFKTNDDKVLNKIFIKVICFILFSIGVYYYSFDMNTRQYEYIIISTISAISGSCLFFSLCKKIKINYISKFFIYCGKNSLLILCIHLLEHSFFPYKWIPVINSYGLILITFKFILIVGCSIIANNISFIKNIFNYK